MNPLAQSAWLGFPNDDCRADRILETANFAICTSTNAADCPYLLLYEKGRLCCHAQCQGIVKRTEERGQ